MEKQDKIKILWLGSGPAMLNNEESNYLLKFKALSTYFYGDIVTPVMHKDYLSIKNTGDFNIHSFCFHMGNPLVRNFLYFKNMLKIIKQLYRNDYDKPQVVISPNPLLSGFLAIFLKKSLKCKSIIEINGCFESAFDFDKQGFSLFKLVQKQISKMLINFSTRRADIVKLLFPEQLDPFMGKKKDKYNLKAFHDFVPITKITDLPTSDKKYFLIMGYPWYLKGVDVLIKAFNNISSKYPEYRLKVIGWCPDQREFFEDLAKGNDKIELGDSVGTSEALKLIAECSIFILASRTEGMGRVFLEAMACKKPIIGSEVGGIPYIIKDNYNGLLFESENVEQLTEKIQLILDNEELYNKLANNGYQFVNNELSDRKYLDNYLEMVKSVL